jgi:hypothetical protein
MPETLDPGRPFALGRHPPLARVVAWGGSPSGGERSYRALGGSGASAPQNDIDCASTALALISDGVPGGLKKEW